MTSNYPTSAAMGWIALALGAALVRGHRERQLGAAGLLCLGLGLAAWRASSADATGPLASPDHLGEGFLAVNGGLIVLGLGLVCWSAASGGSAQRSPVAILAIALGAILVARLSAGLLLAGPGRVAGSAAALGLVGAGLLMLGRTVVSTGPARTLGRWFLSDPLRPALPALPANRGGGAAAAGMLAGAAATALGPHVAVVFLGVITAAWSAFFLFHPRGVRPVPLTPSVTLLLAPAYWLLATIAGPQGLSVATLSLVPLSPAAEWLIAPSLLLVGWSVAGLWPLHRQVPGGLVGVLGAVLLVRTALPLAPAGLEYWRPLSVPVLIAGMWHAAAIARWPLVAVGAGLLGIVGLTPVGVTGAGWLFGAALALELCSMARLRWTLFRLAQVAAWVTAAVGGLLVLEGGLRGEVVYTAVGALGLALLIALPKTQAMTASASSTPAPSA